ncbi:hypothetical protein TRFO_40472 [Tritrichomonas foetus]|uniref:Peptidase M48 domain-containing protein n=1 Tax=Tritrichomonas foetus TaxID=1144522 RepID=A0A1J4J6D9_9EUKA|nr:hypothetical protein TRFO_40472 [Tritrichomonas foetus]|eukprot:OHS93235.1 hypothetical protein TRFO_40472 [Tritrichomonas foetus]
MMYISPAIIPRIALISPSITIFLEIFINSVQYFHLLRSPDSNYHSISAYLSHISTLDSLRYEIVVDLLSLFSFLIVLLSISQLWNLSQSIWKFLLLYNITMFSLYQFPASIIKEYFVKGQTIDIFDLLTTEVYDLFNNLIGQAIVLLIADFVIRKSLPLPSSEPLQPTISDNNENNINQQNINNDNNNNNNNLPARSCCTGKLWIIFLIVSVCTVFIINVYAVDFIMMDKNNFVKLNNATVVKSIKNLTDHVNFPYEYVYMQVNGSPNAFFVGIFKKRIVIVKSLIDLIGDPPLLCAVVAHELGHWFHKDLVKSLFFSIFVMIVLTIYIYFTSNVGLSGFGLGHEIPSVIFLIVIAAAFELPQFLLMAIMNLLSRSFENSADCFAARLGYPIGEALTILTGSINYEIESAELYSLIAENHPSLSKRLININKCLAR